ncbi:MULTISPECIES: hypothetical protein [unclassified Clostridium]|uniref:hypothetical protein n=1 Tax=unclassified Clostridium TaxID=2614128 RepID=UPI0032167896
MKKSKKIYVALSAAILLSGLSLSTALANNCKDSDWYLDASYTNSTSMLTKARPKTDTTSGYGRVISGNIDRNYGMGMQLKRGDNGKDLTGTYRVLPAVSFPGNVEVYVPSNAYENGYRSVKMHISKYRGYNSGCGSSEGKWSPDSV